MLMFPLRLWQPFKKPKGEGEIIAIEPTIQESTDEVAPRPLVKSKVVTHCTKDFIEVSRLMLDRYLTVGEFSLNIGIALATIFVALVSSFIFVIC